MLFVLELVCGLIGYLVGVVSGGVLYCCVSFLFDYVG